MSAHTPPPTPPTTDSTPVRPTATASRSWASTLAAPTIGTGVLMAVYLLLRPYGDAAGGSTPAAAAAFASPAWVAAHICGALAIASFARLALRLSDLDGGGVARAARTLSLAAAVLTLPYYGAETFGLHAIGRAATAGDPGVLRLVAMVRDQPAAVTMFGLGLLALSAGGVLVAIAWTTWARAHHAGHLALGAWPLGLAVALLPVQYFLPPAGRMLFGVGYAAAAAVLLLAAVRRDRVS